jgi:mRNA-degrading endonuclease YafQ of YafQ-DinJ toxin-antitoxin module
MKVVFSKKFVKQVGKLEFRLQEDVFRFVEAFQKNQKDPSLKVHTLTGKLQGLSSFSVNYKTRILFYFPEKEIIELIHVGGHDELYR